MASSHTCPECGGTNRQDEPGRFVLLGLTGNTLQLELDKPTNTMAVVSVSICSDCGLVTLHDA